MPNDVTKRALLAYVIERMNVLGSWCGETHVQKSVFFLQELFETPLEYEYVIYKHGPYSFDLHDELTLMRANALVELEANRPPYGPHFKPGPLAQGLGSRFSRTRVRHMAAVDFVAKRIATLPVVDLERIATAFFLGRERADLKREGLAELITKIKPHISREEALRGIEESEQIKREAKSIAMTP